MTFCQTRTKETVVFRDTGLVDKCANLYQYVYVTFHRGTNMFVDIVTRRWILRRCLCLHTISNISFSQPAACNLKPPQLLKKKCLSTSSHGHT